MRSRRVERSAGHLRLRNRRANLLLVREISYAASFPHAPVRYESTSQSITTTIAPDVRAHRRALTTNESLQMKSAKTRFYKEFAPVKVRVGRWFPNSF